MLYWYLVWPERLSDQTGRAIAARARLTVIQTNHHFKLATTTLCPQHLATSSPMPGSDTLQRHLSMAGQVCRLSAAIRREKGRHEQILMPWIPADLGRFFGFRWRRKVFPQDTMLM